MREDDASEGPASLRLQTSERTPGSPGVPGTDDGTEENRMK